MASPGLSVVLVEPSLPENIGAVARAMDNMGHVDLRLVNPCDYRNASAERLATRSSHILEGATCFDSLEAAIADRKLAIASTARRRERFHDPILLPDIHAHLPDCEVSQASIALVFGRESSGLKNEELACCDFHVRIPTFGHSHSLNLAQAVIVMLYELSRFRPSDEGGQTMVPEQSDTATSFEVEGLKQHLFAVLQLVGFLRPHQQENMWQSFSDLIARARMKSLDVRLIRGFLSRTEGTVKRARRASQPSPRQRTP